MVLPEFHGLIKAIYGRNGTAIANQVLKLAGEIGESVRKQIIANQQRKIQVEMEALCRINQPSILRDHSKDRLVSFTWHSIVKEWEERAPTFLQFLTSCCNSPQQNRNKFKKNEALLPAMVSAGCKLLATRNREMSLLKYINSILMLKGGAKKTLFNRLNHTSKYCT